jgi:hypothetical protein
MWATKYARGATAQLQKFEIGTRLPSNKSCKKWKNSSRDHPRLSRPINRSFRGTTDMGTGMGDGIAKAMTFVFGCCIVGGILVGGLLVWGVPKLWGLVKPWLHQITG